MKYIKPPLTTQQLIDKLQNRGLIITNKERAERYLCLIGYYRLTGYMYHLQERDGTHKFKQKVTFDEVIDTYQFDKKLRNLFSEYIERIEVSMRALLTDNYSPTFGFLWYTEKSRYDSATLIDPHYAKALEEQGKKIPRKYIDTHQYIIKCIRENFATATEQFIVKFKVNYPEDQFPPSNMAMEIFSMGKIAKLFDSLKSCKERDAVSDVFKVPHVVLASWLAFLTNIRNICAHHARLWNRRLTADQFVIPSKKSCKFNGTLPGNFNTTVYGTLSVMMRLLGAINPNNGMLEKLKNLIKEYPNINLQYMGFPEDWEQNPAWLPYKDEAKPS